MKMQEQLITFKDIATCMGIDEARCSISLSLPPLVSDILNFRAFCVADLLLKRLITSGNLKRITGNSWGEVKKIVYLTEDVYVAIVQLSSAPQLFPLEIRASNLVGKKHAIVQRVRKVERDLPNKLQEWTRITQRGMVQGFSSLELIRRMNQSSMRIKKCKVS